MLFDDPGSSVIKMPAKRSAPTGEAATLFSDDNVDALYNDDEVANLFEESTSDSVPNALVPSRLKPCKRVIISPTNRKALRPSARSDRGRRWPALKPVLSAKPTPADAAPRTQDPEDAPTVPTLPSLPRICQSEPLAVSAPKATATAEPEELDTQPDVPLIPIPTPRDLPMLADELEPEPEVQLVPEPIPPARLKPEPPVKSQPEAQVQVQPAPQPRAQPEPAPLPQLAPQPPLKPLAMPVQKAAFIEPEPTLRVMVQAPQRTLSRVQAAGTFMAGAVVASVLFLALAPWSPDKASAPAAEQKVLATTPDTAMRPLTTPLTEPPTKASAPAPVAAAPAPVAQKKATAELTVPGAIPLPEPPVTKANLAGIEVAKTILPCLTHRERFYQKVGVKLSSYGSVRNGLIDRKWGASEKSLACVKKTLRNLRLPHLPAGRYVEWHLAMQGGTPRAWVTYPRDLVVRKR